VRRRGEPGHLADLGDEHRGQHRPDPWDRLDRPVPRIRGQPALRQPGEQVDLDVQLIDQPPQ
jgi:hypothetical protein